MRHIVIHGLSVGNAGNGTPGEVNGTAGYKTVLPVLCGEIKVTGLDPLEIPQALLGRVRNAGEVCRLTGGKAHRR